MRDETIASPGVATGKTESSWLLGTGLIVTLIATVKLVVQLYASGHYGYFVDELYYIACSKHLDLGYVDQPPLIALITALERIVLGESLRAIRFLPGLAGVGLIFLTGLFARELGAGRFGQGLAALAVLLAPGFLATDNLLSMNAFEPLFWVGCAYLYVRIVKTGNQKLWLWFGAVAGVGLENKHSMLIFGFGLIAGILLAGQWRMLRTPWVWVGGLVALAIFLPNLIWNIQHHFPFLELQANIKRNGRNVDLTPASFLAQQLLTMFPMSAPIWLAGLWFYFARPEGRRFRAAGWAWVIALAIILIFNPRVYYLWPAFPVLFAAGATMWEKRLSHPRVRWVRVAYPALMVLVGIVVAPMAIPVLPVETYIRYETALHLKAPAIEKWKLGPLPQIYADQFGWKEMVETVARVYNSLPPDVRAKTAIFGQNYGQAGAIDLFGPRYGLPAAISGHQSYFYWGPRDYTGESILVMDTNKQFMDSVCTSSEKVARVDDPYSMPYEHFDVFYCHGLKWPLKEYWPKVKNWN